MFTAFDGPRLLQRGARPSIVAAINALLARRPDAQVLIFEDATGTQIDFDLRRTEPDGEQGPEPRGPGRPRLGVTAREVTLLPRHWEWLSAQPGGASVTLRKLVDDARRANAGKDRLRAAQTRAYSFMSAMAGDLPGFEEAIRALFARDEAKLHAQIANWPKDIREYALKLAAVDPDGDG